MARRGIFVSHVLHTYESETSGVDEGRDAAARGQTVQRKPFSFAIQLQLAMPPTNKSLRKRRTYIGKYTFSDFVRSRLERDGDGSGVDVITDMCLTTACRNCRT